MIKTFCDRCGKETTGQPHGAISGIEDANDNGDGTNQAPDCFDIVCEDCFEAWRVWMKSAAEARAGVSMTVLGGTDLDVVATEGGKASVERRR